jgi:RNA polymerase sigma-70 factor (ECF subfamily)
VLRQEVGVDVALVDRAAAGDADAFESLIRPRLTPIYRLCLGLLANQADAADATQEALVAAWRQLPRLRDPASFDPWLRRIAYNACRMALRRRRTLREVHVDPTVAAGMHRSTVEPELVEAFAALPIEQRAILVLHHLEGTPLSEIATTLDVPVGTVKSRLFAARQALATAVGEGGET